MHSPFRRFLWIVWYPALLSCCAVRAVNVVPEGVSAASGPVVVDGRPAIAWAGASGGIRYVSASGTNGDAWGSPVNVDPQGWPGGRLCLAVANGNPAVAYFSGLQTMKFARARD